MDGGAWKAAVHGVVEGRTRLSDFTHFIISLNWEGFPGCSVVKKLPVKNETQVWPLGWEDPLEKEMATHSSNLTWKISWMEEPGRLQPMASQRVGHEWATSLSLLKMELKYFVIKYRKHIKNWELYNTFVNYSAWQILSFGFFSNFLL